jgi:hypothetical protein
MNQQMKKLLFSLLFILVFLPVTGFAQTATNEELLDFVTKPSTNTTGTTAPSPELQNFLNNIKETSNLSEEDQLILNFKTNETASDYIKRIETENAVRKTLGKTLLPDPKISTTQIPERESVTQLGPKPPIPQPESVKTGTPLPNTGILDQIVPSSLFGGQPINKLLNQLFYVGLVVAVLLAIVMIIRGGVEYMTIDAIASKENGKNRIKAAMGGLLLAFSAILILNTINPGLTSLSIKFEQLKQIKGVTIGGITSGMRGAGGSWDKMAPSGEGEVAPEATAYSPQKKGSTLQGGYASSKPGLDGQFLVRTLDDYANGSAGYITLAGDPNLYGKSYIIPQITYINSSGQTVNLSNVKGYVHDTGSAFTGKGSSRIDIPVGKDYSYDQLKKQPFSRTDVKLIPAK